jgi:hypothetical protein
MHRLVLALAAAAALTLAVVGVASAHRATDADPKVFSDQVGDSASATDISGISVTNDETGRYRIDVTFANYYAAPAELDIYLDTDMSTNTGDPKLSGADYILADYQDDHSYAFYKWDGADWQPQDHASPVEVTVGTEHKDIEFLINKSDLADTKGFNFWLGTYRLDGNDDYDVAPAGTDTWQYKFQGTVKLALDGAHSTPAKAGGKWTLALAARRSDNGQYLGGEGTITCAASSGPTKLKTLGHAFVGTGGGDVTVAGCVFSVPKKLKHKTLRGTITVSYKGSTVTKTFTTIAK